MPPVANASAAPTRDPARSAPRLVVLSPHRDDAAFSSGVLLAVAAATGIPVTILNVFTDSVYAPFGQANLSRTEITELRRSEDLAVTALLGHTAELADLGLLDAPLRLGIRDDQVVSGPLDSGQMAEQVGLLQAALPDLSAADLVLIPLALGAHVDHRIVRNAGLAAVSPDRLGFYQDLPYASRTASAEALARETAAILKEAGDTTQTSFAASLLRAGTELQVKQRLLDCYSSQVAPETVDEMVRWTRTLGGELLYLSTAARARLQALLPMASLTPANDLPPERG